MDQTQGKADKKILTVKQLADRIGFHVMTVYKWIANRGLPVHRVGANGRVSIYWDEFDAWWSQDKNERWERM